MWQVMVMWLHHVVMTVGDMTDVTDMTDMTDMLRILLTPVHYYVRRSTLHSYALHCISED